ncbi:MAG: SH3 domain-containing protein, partial [Promicromonosporaceae bacterium]|nr:SH3 domain-containing protein [Promicromonosporaceae bacterium]
MNVIAVRVACFSLIVTLKSNGFITIRQFLIAESLIAESLSSAGVIMNRKLMRVVASLAIVVGGSAVAVAPASAAEMAAPSSVSQLLPMCDDVNGCWGYPDVMLGNVNMRAKPNCGAKIVGTAKNKATVNVLDNTSTGWYKINYKGTIGWVSGYYVGSAPVYDKLCSSTAAK